MSLVVQLIANQLLSSLTFTLAFVVLVLWRCLFPNILCISAVRYQILQFALVLHRYILYYIMNVFTVGISGMIGFNLFILSLQISFSLDEVLQQLEFLVVRLLLLQNIRIIAFYIWNWTRLFGVCMLLHVNFCPLIIGHALQLLIGNCSHSRILRLQLVL